MAVIWTFVGLESLFFDQPLTFLLLLTGNRVPAGELEWAGPQRLRRAGSGRFFQGAQSEEGESLLPV